MQSVRVRKAFGRMCAGAAGGAAVGDRDGDRGDPALRLLLPRGQGRHPQRGVGLDVRGEARARGPGLLRALAQPHEGLDARLHRAVRPGCKPRVVGTLCWPSGKLARGCSVWEVEILLVSSCEHITMTKAAHGTQGGCHDCQCLAVLSVQHRTCPNARVAIAYSMWIMITVPSTCC